MTHKGKKLGIIVQILKDYDILFDNINEKILFRRPGDETYTVDLTDLNNESPKWHDCYEYRIKPEVVWCVCETIGHRLQIMELEDAIESAVLFKGTNEECYNWTVEHEKKCPCEDGVDSKACAGCPKDEERKLTFRPFKDCDELVEFWSKNYQTGFRPAYTKPLIWVRLKCDGRERLIVAFGKGFGTDFVEIGNKAKAVTLQKLFDDYEFLDCKPCKMEVEE